MYIHSLIFLHPSSRHCLFFIFIYPCYSKTIFITWSALIMQTAIGPVFMSIVPEMSHHRRHPKNHNDLVLTDGIVRLYCVWLFLFTIKSKRLAIVFQQAGKKKAQTTCIIRLGHCLWERAGRWEREGREKKLG